MEKSLRWPSTTPFYYCCYCFYWFLLFNSIQSLRQTLWAQQSASRHRRPTDHNGTSYVGQSHVIVNRPLLQKHKKATKKRKNHFSFAASNLCTRICSPDLFLFFISFWFRLEHPFRQRKGLEKRNRKYFEKCCIVSLISEWVWAVSVEEVAIPCDFSILEKRDSRERAPPHSSVLVLCMVCASQNVLRIECEIRVFLFWNSCISIYTPPLPLLPPPSPPPPPWHNILNSLGCLHKAIL